MMSQPPFQDHAAALEYAERNGLDLVWAGTAAFEKRRATLPAGAFEVRTYLSRKGVKSCGLFSKQFRHVEFMVARNIVEIDGDGVIRVLDEQAFAMVGGLAGKG